MMEDPAEDLFVCNTITKEGDFKLFIGWAPSASHHIEILCNILTTSRRPSFLSALKNETFSLLALSNLLAERCGFSKYFF